MIRGLGLPCDISSVITERERQRIGQDLHDSLGRPQAALTSRRKWILRLVPRLSGFQQKHPLMPSRLFAASPAFDEQRQRSITSAMTIMGFENPSTS
jgi:hypothetical protein